MHDIRTASRSPVVRHRIADRLRRTAHFELEKRNLFVAEVLTRLADWLDR